MSVRHLAANAYWKKCSVHATLRCILCEPNKDWDLFGSWKYFLIHLTRLDRKGKNNKNCHPRKIMEIYWIHGISPVGRPCHHRQDTLQTPNWWILKLTNETDRQQVGESGRNSPGMMISLLLIDTYSIVACLGASSHTHTLSWDLIELPELIILKIWCCSIISFCIDLEALKIDTATKYAKRSHNINAAAYYYAVFQVDSSSGSSFLQGTAYRCVCVVQFSTSINNVVLVCVSYLL